MAKPKNIKKFISHVNYAHKQQIEHVNEYPLDLSGLSAVKSISKTYYNKDLTPATTVNELLTRKPKFEFYVYLNKTKYTLPAHHFVFDKQEDATKAYKYYMSTMIDEKIEPYRQIVAKGGKLTDIQIAECQKIQSLLED